MNTKASLCGAVAFDLVDPDETVDASTGWLVVLGDDLPRAVGKVVLHLAGFGSRPRLAHAYRLCVIGRCVGRVGAQSDVDAVVEAGERGVVVAAGSR